MARLNRKFSLRLIFALTTVCAVACATYERRQDLNTLISRLHELGAKIEFHPIRFWEKPGSYSNIRAIDLSHTAVVDSDLRKIYRLRRLERLDLAQTSISEKGLSHLSSSDRIRKLSLRRCTKLGDETFLILRRLSRLEDLDVFGARISSFKDVDNLPAIKHLVYGMQSLSSEGIQAIARIKATGIGNVTIQNVSIKDLRTLATTDLAHSPTLFITQYPRSSSKISIEDIESLGKHRFKNVEMHLSNYSKIEVARRAGSRCSSLYARRSGTRRNKLIYELMPDRFGQRLRIVQHNGTGPIIDAISALPNLTLLDSDYTTTGQVSSVYACLRPTIHVQMQPQTADIIAKDPARRRVWRDVAKATKLKSLTILTDCIDGLKFTQRHKLERLVIIPSLEKFHDGGVSLYDDGVFREIAKLNDLKRLTYRSQIPLSSEVAPIGSLNGLTQITIGPLTANGRDSLNSMGFELKPIAIDKMGTNREMWAGTRKVGSDPLKVSHLKE